MRGAHLSVVVIPLCIVLALLASSTGAAGPSSTVAGVPNRPLRTAVHLHLPLETYPEPAARAFKRIAAAGATVVRLPVVWSDVSPTTRPAGFRPDDPGDPGYRWDVLDESVREAARNRLQPLVFFYDPPSWAAREPYPDYAPNILPVPSEVASFAKALATRYSGSYQGLPRVRYWQAWNEPNLSLYVKPQLVDKRPVSPGWYRDTLIRFAAAVRSVRGDNLVVAGGTAPFRDITPEVLEQNKDWGPLSFMRELLCISKDLRPTCNTRVPFDVWAHHPYTSGGPTHNAALPNDVSLGDLPEMKRLLDAAVKAGHVVTRGGQPQFWVTEFSWDSQPPDPKAVPTALLLRWVPEALYRMWESGVSLVTWFTLRDQPLSTSYYQSGLYYRGATVAKDRPKPYLAAFRFPFVAFREGPRVLVWGRSPTGRQRQVVVEQKAPAGWKRLGVVRTNAHGVFQSRLTTSLTGNLRARAAEGSISLPFSLRKMPDRFYNPFGLPELLEPRP